MKIAVITNNEYEFREFVRRTGAGPELAKCFYPVEEKRDALGQEFNFVLHTLLAERNMRGFWELLHLCKLRIRPEQH